MAAVTQTDTITIEINDIPVEVPKGELIVEAVKRIGLEIPIFCYHPRMKPVGMCRMCLVEVGFKQPDGSVRKMPKPQAGCTLPASENMVVYTDSELVHKDRKGVLEFLLINHPLDCPICDRGGECPLQNNTLAYGPSTSRYLEIKRHQPKAFPLSQYVTLDLERCIQCGRCVRFTEEISGDSQLAFRFRGADMQPSTFELRDFDSKFSGNVIEICPVGALTSSKYRFRARPWDVETQAGICTLCSNGCSIWFDHRLGKMARINGRTHEGVNEEWTCDRGKFGHEFYNDEHRLSYPFLRNEDRLEPCTWGDVYQPIADAFAGGSGAALAGDQLSNESYFLLKKLFNNAFQSNRIDTRLTLSAHDRPARIESTIASIEHEPSLLVFGTSLADELPIIYLRVRKAWFSHGAKVVVMHHKPTDADSFANVVIHYKEGAALEAAQALEACLKGGSPDAAALSATGVSAETFQAAASILKSNPGATILSQANRNFEKDDQIVACLQSATAAFGGKFNEYATGCNDQGAAELGLHSPGDAHTDAILEDCIAGKIKALWLAGIDPLQSGLNRDKVLRALETVEFLVVQGIAESEVLAYASVVLPMTAPAEQDGTYTNAERRVQSMSAILAPRGDAKPAWRVYAELLLRSGASEPYFGSSDVLSEICRTVPAFGAIAETGLTGDGAFLQ